MGHGIATSLQSKISHFNAAGECVNEIESIFSTGLLLVEKINLLISTFLKSKEQLRNWSLGRNPHISPMPPTLQDTLL